MLLWLADYLSQYYIGFSVLNYLTMRGILGVLTALFIAMVIGPYMIEHLKYRQIVLGQALFRHCFAVPYPAYPRVQESYSPIETPKHQQ